MGRRPTAVVDVAHNVASAEALADAIGASFQPGRRVLVFAGTKLKDSATMLRVLLPRFDEVIFTRYRVNPRSVPTGELRSIAASLGASHGRICDDPLEAWRLARSLADEESLICVTGSFFIAAELRPVIQLQETPSPFGRGQGEGEAFTVSHPHPGPLPKGDGEVGKGEGGIAVTKTADAGRRLDREVHPAALVPGAGSPLR
jgi:hypothetical protein